MRGPANPGAGVARHPGAQKSPRTGRGPGL